MGCSISESCLSLVNDKPPDQCPESQHRRSRKLTRTASLYLSLQDIDSNNVFGEDVDEADEIRDIKKVALIAHNNMKPALKNFVTKHKAILVNYTLTGTQTTLNMVKSVMAEYHKSGRLKLGEPCSSGPFGGDAQLSAEIVAGSVGCVIFFVDPLTAHPHQSDIESLLRLARVHEVLLATNEITAFCVVRALRDALQNSDALPASMSPSVRAMSPSVAMYKRRESVQRAAQMSNT